MSDPRADDLIRQVKRVAPRGLPPVQRWHPERVGEIDIRIDRRGEWFYLGTPFRRQAIVRLFSTILRRDGDDYFLVTPAEKLKIQVEDAPFQVVALEEQGEGDSATLWFTTDQGDRVRADTDHPIRVETDPETQEPTPYLRVRDRLEGRISRPLFYRLVERAEAVAEAGGVRLWLHSAGAAFPLGPAIADGE